MIRYLFLTLSSAILASCASSPDVRSERALSLQVAGFVQAQGITWLGWPNRVQEALEGFPGILHVSFVVETERFDITYDADEATPEAIAQVVRDLGYEPTPVRRASSATIPQTRFALAELPAELQALFEQARQAKKQVLLDFTAPGWIACHQMDTVTYPHPAVQKELENWVEGHVDVVESTDVARLFEVTAVPVAVLVAPDGALMGRVPNFVQPEEFTAALTRARGGAE